jgi:hypothetical protein
MNTSSLVRVLAPLAVPLALVIAELPLLFPAPAVGDNLQFWAAGHMVVTGASPYSRSAWETIAAYGAVPGGVAANTAGLNLAITQQVWLYPPQTAFLFAPFGLLPYEIGVPLLHAFIAMSALAAIVVVALLAGLRGTHLAFALTLAVVSQPFVIAVRNGHPVGLLLLGGVVLLVGLRDRRDVLVAAGVALLTLKPQLVLPLAIFAVGYTLARRDMRRLWVMTLAAVAVTVPFEIATPFPLGAVAASTGERLGVDLSTIAALARDLGGGTALTLLFAAVTVAACALAVVWANRDERPIVLAASLFVLSLALSPYVHDYDLLIGIPSAFAIVAVGAVRRTGLVASLGAALSLVVAPWLLFYWWPLTGEGARIFQGGPLGAVPIVFAVALVLAAYVGRHARTVGRTTHDRPPHPPERQMA